ncbi:SIR2 family protein [Caldichromatium japonicum]|uniref:SIR2 family protein n=1 Tax=Caldichromatium japonicum TaxID=2699430 RepID=A0A6G7VEZ7_9GAMM|nr:SIR2 family protein [Caldichromatium japonicum]QIK38554.1 SIR2 family protein [Caldichromatium japonicum]
MTLPVTQTELLAGIKDGSIVPYLGPGVLADVRNTATGVPMPATSEELILAMNSGRPMAPKLMYEFPRAAMHVELKRGRAAVTKFLDATYGTTQWSRAAVHDWLKALQPGYVIDINRDTQLLDSYAGVPHLLVQGCARIGGTDYRFRLYQYDGRDYRTVAPEQAPEGLPVLFKPMGAPRPQSSYIASDADYVDYITELMGGFAVPSFVKRLRQGKRYLFLGMRFTRDTERMVMKDLIYGAGSPAGWALIDSPTDKERRFLTRLGIEILPVGISWLLDQLDCSAAQASNACA